MRLYTGNMRHTRCTLDHALKHCPFDSTERGRTSSTCSYRMWMHWNDLSPILPTSSRPMRCCCSNVPHFWSYRIVSASSTKICIASKRCRTSSNSSSCRARNWVPSSNRWRCAIVNLLHSSIHSPATHTLW